MKKTEFWEIFEGRVDVSALGNPQEEREAFFEYLDKVRKTGVKYADIEFSAGSDFVFNLKICLDQTKWRHPSWPKAEATLRLVKTV